MTQGNANNSDLAYIEDYELIIYRLWAVAVAIFLPLYGLALKYLDSTAIDFISHRLIISGLLTCLLLLSFTSSFVKKHFTNFSIIANYIWVGWVIWIVYINNFSINYTLGLFMAITLPGIIFRSRKEMLYFYIFNLLLTSIAITNCANFSINKYILALTLIIMLGIYIISYLQRNYILNHVSTLNQKLTRANKDLVVLNNNLEKKVADRTKIIQEKTLKLTAKNEELNRFTSIVSHDLKAPLRTISAFAGILDKETADQENPKIKECTQFLNSGVNRMVSIIDDLLEYSKLDEQALLFKAANPEKMLFLVLQSITTNRSDVQVKISKNLPPQIICNTRQIEQLFQNLIDNGIKYNRNPIKKISIDCQDTPTEWIFTVQDNGIGISSSYREKIFEMFQRLHSNDEFKGTGIGLAICKRIIENHQGTISLQSEEGQGTVFTFSISKNLASKTPLQPKSTSKKASSSPLQPKLTLKI